MKIRIRCRTKNGKLTSERLRELFEYRPETGELIRRVKASNMLPGTVAGSVRPDGRRQIGIDGSMYLSSRIIWLYVHGVWPPVDIDHKDRHKGNDRLENLRPATRLENVINRSKWTGESKYIGVSRKRRKWSAQIQVDGSHFRLGVFENEEDAARARDSVARRVYGEFAVTNFNESA